MEKPLAIKLRPNSLSECLGQKHLIGENKILSNLVKNKKLFSIVKSSNFLNFIRPTPNELYHILKNCCNILQKFHRRH